MNKNAVLILHGFFEHKGRHEINAKWFQKLNIDSHLIDLPGHGEFVEKRGSIDSWDEMDKSLKDGFKKIENYGLNTLNNVLKEIKIYINGLR